MQAENVFKLELVQRSADSSCLAYGDAVPCPKLRAQPKPGLSFLSGGVCVCRGEEGLGGLAAGVGVGGLVLNLETSMT